MSWLHGVPFLPRPRDEWERGLIHALAQMHAQIQQGMSGIHSQHALARATADLTANSVNATLVPGCSITIRLRRPADALVFGVYRVMQTGGTTLRNFIGGYIFNAVLLGQVATINFTALNEIKLATQIWRQPNLKANTPYTFQISGHCDNAADTFVVDSDESAIAVLTSGQLD